MLVTVAIGISAPFFEVALLLFAVDFSVRLDVKVELSSILFVTIEILALSLSPVVLVLADLVKI